MTVAEALVAAGAEVTAARIYFKLTLRPAGWTRSAGGPIRWA